MSFQVVVTTMEGADRLPCSLVSRGRRYLSKEHSPVTNLNGLVTSLSSSSAILTIANEGSDILEDACSYLLPGTSILEEEVQTPGGSMQVVWELLASR